jgi:HAD superfamily hydrolase (TIGR01509 family)
MHGTARRIWSRLCSAAPKNGELMSAPPVALIIFDCDGVLIDSEVLSARILIEEVAAHGVSLTPAYVRDNFLGRSFPTVAQIIRERFALVLPPSFEARYRARLLEQFETELRTTPGLLQLLPRIGCRSCVATSSSPPRVARSLAISGLDRFFTDVFTASLVKAGKPAPDLFLYAAAAMGLAPAECLVIEDSRPGIAAAQAAGMQVLLYTGGSHMQGMAFDTTPPVQAFEHWDQLAQLHPALMKDPS